MVKRAGLLSEQDFFNSFNNNINSYENSPGRFYQSLTQASFNTWSDGPFGKQGEDADKAISYYDKGPVVGLILDFKIRNATQNKKSLDEVMRLLYQQYYKKLQRGFTDAEFQQACESVAGVSMAPEFEYVYTTRELDYNRYLFYAGLKVTVETDKQKEVRKFIISKLDSVDSLQSSILNAWQGK
jgi:predicted metalloprotease with PDZ domain